ncbi:MAG: TonB family protein [Pseudomonadota bacterium]|nr:TonB family protein [Pseudomonadota bacterium]
MEINKKIGKNDRLKSMFFLVALVHGILILGVTFTSIPPDNINNVLRPPVTLITHITGFRSKTDQKAHLVPEDKHEKKLQVENSVPVAQKKFKIRAITPNSVAHKPLDNPNIHDPALAKYLSAWRNKVEQVGTENFPEKAQKNSLGNPILEVILRADGTLQKTLVLRSSGNEALDQAALGILSLATPFGPLPELVQAEYDTLRFAYEWEFTMGSDKKRPGS